MRVSIQIIINNPDPDDPENISLKVCEHGRGKKRRLQESDSTVNGNGKGKFYIFKQGDTQPEALPLLVTGDAQSNSLSGFTNFIIFIYLTIATYC